MINRTTASRDNRRPFYAVWIGVMSMQSPSKIELQKDRNGLLNTASPRLNWLRIKTQSFQRIADPFIWNFIIEKNTDDNDKSSPSSSYVSSTSPSSTTTTTTTTTSSSSSSPPAPANKKRKLNKGTINEDVSSNDDYPHLLRALGKEEDGFNPADPTIQKIMCALLAELIDLLSKDYELNFIDSTNNSVTYVCVPKTSSDRSFQNSKEWVNVPSKLPGQNTEAPTTPLTASPTTYSASTKTPSLPPARLKYYLCRNRRLQHNSLHWWMH